MKELQEEFEGRGEVRNFIFKELKKTDKAYLYMATDEHNNITYEVFERKENTQFDCVSYPKSNAFGIWAFCMKNLEKANEMFVQLNSKEKKKIVDLEPQDDDIEENDINNTEE